MSVIDTDIFVYSLGYIVMAALIVSPPSEFISAGLTVQNLLSNLLGSEQINFIEYHLRRTTATLIIHSLLPLGYYMGMVVTSADTNFLRPWLLSITWRIYFLCSVTVLLSAALLAAYWLHDRWRCHPIAQCLTTLAPASSTWRAVASSVNVEFRRIDKFTTGPPGRRLIVTDSWLILTSTYAVRVAHQRDIHLSIVGSDEHAVHYESAVGAQFLNLRVSGVNTKPFQIRLNAAEYSDLRDKLRSPILNVRNIVIRQSLSDRFLDAFIFQINENETFHKPSEMVLEQCIGCMQIDANVKLQKCCSDNNVPGDAAVGGDAESSCLQCYCRPMWCLDCMGKWFASRQDQTRPETWLGSRAPCPTCRAKFCVLDVCRIV